MSQRALYQHNVHFMHHDMYADCLARLTLLLYPQKNTTVTVTLSLYHKCISLVNAGRSEEEKLQNAHVWRRFGTF
jgi:hypothetical protein